MALFSGEENFFRHIVMFIVILALLGFILILFGHTDIFSGIFLLFLSIFINYIKSSGLFIVKSRMYWNDKHVTLIDIALSLAVIALFGYKFINIYSKNIFSIIIYSGFYFIYIVYIYFSYRSR
ncbi:MAG TPA: hypothetical protein DD426_00915 [Clostridiaceae bacterium]|nr:hypothetical protein [Clostridiaceae bacterium]